METERFCHGLKIVSRINLQEKWVQIPPNLKQSFLKNTNRNVEYFIYHIQPLSESKLKHEAEEIPPTHLRYPRVSLLFFKRNGSPLDFEGISDVTIGTLTEPKWSNPKSQPQRITILKQNPPNTTQEYEHVYQRNTKVWWTIYYDDLHIIPLCMQWITKHSRESVSVTRSWKSQVFVILVQGNYITLSVGRNRCRIMECCGRSITVWGKSLWNGTIAFKSSYPTLIVVIKMFSFLKLLSFTTVTINEYKYNVPSNEWI